MAALLSGSIIPGVFPEKVISLNIVLSKSGTEKDRLRSPRFSSCLRTCFVVRVSPSTGQRASKKRNWASAWRGGMIDVIGRAERVVEIHPARLQGNYHEIRVELGDKVELAVHARQIEQDERRSTLSLSKGTREVLLGHVWEDMERAASRKLHRNILVRLRVPSWHLNFPEKLVELRRVLVRVTVHDRDLPALHGQFDPNKERTLVVLQLPPLPDA